MSTQRAHSFATSPLPNGINLGVVGIWFFRALLLVPFVLMAPLIFSAIAGRPDAITNISASNADVLGTSTFLIFITMLAVTPVHTLTGWRWHIVLRRDYGIAMFFTAALDIVLAAIATADTFPGTVLTRVGGHSFLVAGTLSTFMLVPLVVTANRPAQRWMGRHWKSIQRLTYVVWATVLLHLLLLFGLSTIFLYALAVSLPLALMRVPQIRRWWDSARRNGAHHVLRVAIAAVLVAIFAAGYVPLVRELADKGGAAFMQHPVID
jgi:methionine sulfoxide reductase heme-binding subunit